MSPKQKLITTKVTIGLGYKLVRLLMALANPEVTLIELALMTLGWCLGFHRGRGPPSGWD